MIRKSRREFLDYLARIGMTLPILPSAVKAGPIANRKRLIVLFTGNGQYADHWYPKTDIELDALGSRCRGIQLAKISGPISLIFDESFDRFRSKINLIRGIDLIPVDVEPHGMTKGTLSGLVRGQGLRRCRFRGKSKAILQAKMSGAAANISRLHRKIQIESARSGKIAA